MKKLFLCVSLLFTIALMGSEEAKADLATKKVDNQREQAVSPFTFGSYGRIGFASSLDKLSGYETNLVSHGSRIELSPYQEIWMNYDFTDKVSAADGARVRLITATAFTENYFHYDGQFDVKTAIRNMYIDIDNVPVKNLNLWVGSRMYRGDDIYLFDFWPLDNLNTMGAGLGYSYKMEPGELFFKLHMGVNRIDEGEVKDPYQYDYYSVPLKGGAGKTDILILDRQRYISSFMAGFRTNMNLNFKLYGEYHVIGKGEHKKDGVTEELPEDSGFVIGFQATYYGFSKNGYAHLFAKYAKDLAAYGEMGIPYGVNNEKKSTGAHEFLVGLTANYEHDLFGAMVGGYFRTFKDADVNTYDTDDYSEGIVDLRLVYYATRTIHLATEFSYQMLKTTNLDIDTNKQESYNLFKIAVMPTLSPNGKGNLMQPQIRLVYTFSKYNDAAQNHYLYEEDPRSSKSTHHYLGIMTEWWFNNL